MFAIRLLPSETCGATWTWRLRVFGALAADFFFGGSAFGGSAFGSSTFGSFMSGSLMSGALIFGATLGSLTSTASTGAGLLVAGSNLGVDSTTDVEVREDLHAPGLCRADQIVQDAVRDVLMKGTGLSIGPDVELERLELHTESIGDIGNAHAGEVGLPGLGTKAGELGTVDFDLVLSLRVRIVEDFEFLTCLAAHTESLGLAQE